MKEKLIELVRRTQQEQRTFADKLTDQERAQVGTPEQWSAKDVVAHIYSWVNSTMERHAIAMRGETPPDLPDDDQQNAIFFEAHRHKSWEELQREIDEICDREIAWIQAMRDNDLTDPNQTTWHGGRPMWNRIASNNGTHALIHLAEWHTKHGRQSYALQMHENFAPLLLSLDDSPDWRGVTIYNLACYHALAGDKEQALSKLAESLRLRPDLTDWSKQDPDLASLRDDPAYAALYAQ
jgi:hypothetical protein